MSPLWVEQARQAAPAGILAEGWSFLAEEDGLAGVVLCTLATKGEGDTEQAGVYPENFKKLQRFFGDLKTNYGEWKMSDAVASDQVIYEN